MGLFKENQQGIPKFVNDPTSEKPQQGIEDIEEGYMDATVKQ